MELVSIIIPIFNAEKTIANTLRSISSQSYTYFEALLINDGSTDKTIEIISRFTNSDTRFKLINQPNGGVSKARNTGIDSANGKYIAFIDADDVIKKDYIKNLMASIENNDLAICNFSRITSNGHQHKKNQLKGLNDKTVNIEIIKRVIRVNNSIMGVVWRTLFKSSIIKSNSLYFDTKLKMSEDYKFLLQYLNKIRDVGICQDFLYEYRENIASATGKYMQQLDSSLKSVNCWLGEFIMELTPEERNEVWDGYQKSLSNSIVESLQNTKRNGSPIIDENRARYINDNWLNEPLYLEALRYSIKNNDQSGYSLLRSLQLRQILKMKKSY